MENFQIDENQELILEDGKWILHVNGVPQVGIPKSIFKYYSLNKNNLDAIQNNYFFLSNPKDFNDPFDCNYNLIKEQQKDFIDGFPPPSLNDIANKGITSFSTNGMHPLLWGHYTGSFNGFVVEYKTEIQIIRLPGIIKEKLMRIIYSKSPNPVSENSPFANQYQLIIKLDHWSYENEWRLIVDKNDYSLNKIQYDPSSVKSISFGYQMSLLGKSKEHYELRDELMRIFRNKYPNIPKYIVGPDAIKLELKKVQLYEANGTENINIILK